MATSSPVPSNKSADSVVATSTTSNGNTTPQRSLMFEMPKQNLRGMNKPKCIKCGNVARSRCPFQSCKNCCAKAQNPCHIHVLKTNGTLPDKAPNSTSPASEAPSADLPSTGASWRLNSLRQLSTTFVNTLRVRKPLSRKDAININKWRFSRLKQYNDGEIEAENEAFERYMENVRLLEETFHTGELVKSEELITSETDSSAEKVQKLISEIKVKLKSNAERAESIRKRVRNLVDQKLGNLQSAGLVDDENFSGTDDLDGDNVAKRAKIEKWRVERTVAVDALIDKLNKARSEDDLKSCLETKQLLFNQTKNMDDLLSHLCSHSLCNKTYTAVDVNQDSLANVNAEFSALDQVAEL
ncbi:uncharacterized protein LOC120278426 isoform X1 [Dioscorea cayenensis subsp. rotundata]|uniref:Uncharacterized protein LOC120278426 isoform X1 n=1 Tax=Dioscorea cayennensis subsp. rotundata TaxID=55577 RepID=A0AB40CNQ2_DIOCR|nr:uncharacterized protein LOC120278426 isoform X1 [Dioscorea cayenensis subsp. rotundata]